MLDTSNVWNSDDCEMQEASEGWGLYQMNIWTIYQLHVYVNK